MSVEPHTTKAKLSKLMPTQFAVGFAEVEEKRKRWHKMPKRERETYLSGHVVPVVKGPHGLHLIDHHHEGRGLLLEGQKEVLIQTLADLSDLALSEFWQEMMACGWCYLWDAHGAFRSADKLPLTLAELQDDPWRSLAGFVKEAGGYAKSQQPFTEFRWARFLQLRMKKPDLKEAMKLAQSKEARHLPGWHPKVG